MSFGNGTKFFFPVDETLTDIGNAIVELGELAMSRDTTDDNRYSDNTEYKKYAGGMKDAGSVTIKLELDRQEGYDVLLRNAFNSPNTQQAGFDWPNVAKTSFRCETLVTGYKVTHAIGEKLYCSVDLQFSGEPEWGNWT